MLSVFVMAEFITKKLQWWISVRCRTHVKIDFPWQNIQKCHRTVFFLWPRKFHHRTIFWFCLQNVTGWLDMWRASQTPHVEKVQFHLLFSDLSTCHYIIIILFDHLSFPDSATCFHVWSRFIFLLVHMSSLGFVTCHYLLWPCVLS